MESTTLFQHIDWCTCSLPNYGDEGCDCPDVDIFHKKLSQGMTRDEALYSIFEEERDWVKSLQVIDQIKKSNKSVKFV